MLLFCRHHMPLLEVKTFFVGFTPKYPKRVIFVFVWMGLAVKWFWKGCFLLSFTTSRCFHFKWFHAFKWVCISRDGSDPTMLNIYLSAYCKTEMNSITCSFTCHRHIHDDHVKERDARDAEWKLTIRKKGRKPTVKNCVTCKHKSFETL